MIDNGLEGNEVEFKVDARPDCEPMEITNHLCDTGVHVGFGLYRMKYTRGPESQRVQESLYSLQLFDISVVYTTEKGVEEVGTASDYCVGHRYGGVLVKMFANAPKLEHVVVATLDYRVNDKVEM